MVTKSTNPAVLISSLSPPHCSSLQQRFWTFSSDFEQWTSNLAPGGTTQSLPADLYKLPGPQSRVSIQVSQDLWPQDTGKDPPGKNLVKQMGLISLCTARLNTGLFNLPVYCIDLVHCFHKALLSCVFIVNLLVDVSMLTKLLSLGQLAGCTYLTRPAFLKNANNPAEGSSRPQIKWKRHQEKNCLRAGIWLMWIKFDMQHLEYSLNVQYGYGEIWKQIFN